jgi:hypothetical protein
MFERREKLLADHELEAEQREKDLEERIWKFQVVQAAPGSQAAEAMKEAREDLQAEHRAGVQRIAAWVGEASTTLVPLGVSPILVSEVSASISDALLVLTPSRTASVTWTRYLAPAWRPKAAGSAGR